jgi:hypothetical protein
MLSSSKRTASGEVLIPDPLDERGVVRDHPREFAKRPGIEPLVLSHRDAGANPELCLRAAAADVDAFVENVQWDGVNRRLGFADQAARVLAG